MADGAHATNALRVAAELSRDPVIVTTGFDGDGRPRVLFANHAFRAETDLDLDDIQAGCSWSFLGAAGGAAPLADVAQLAATGEAFDTGVACARRDGSRWLADVHMSPVRDGTGAVSHYVATYRSRETRPAATERSQDAHLDALAALFERNPDGVLRVDGAGRVRAANAAALAIAGYAADELVGVAFESLSAPDCPSRRAAHRRGGWAAAAERWSMRLVHRQGHTVPLRVSSVPVGDAGGLLVLAPIEPREDESEGRESEEQLRQSRKMEAVGRLAGGIAHDFNNLLTAIAAYADFLLDELPVADPRLGDVQEIRDAVDRAVELTRPLLSFTRRRRSEPQVVELAAVVGGMEKLLRRVIGEDVELVTVLRQPAGRVRADAGQLEQVVMNLAVNARDAMPDGGALVIETANVDVAADASARTREAVELARLVERGEIEAGPYVMLAVSDTGVGMDAATQARLFEPFFTTKAPGQGTGLGLATVRDIVLEAGGHVTLYSEPGGGSLFRIYVPRVDAEAHTPGLPAPWELTGGGEVIVVVEDDPAIRKIARRVLQRRGYTVLDAADGSSALELCARHDGRIDLLLADVVMPALGGFELAAQLRHFRPAMRVLYMTGYAEGAPTRQAVDRAAADVLEKPFTPAVLARRVRAALDARADD